MLKTCEKINELVKELEAIDLKKMGGCKKLVLQGYLHTLQLAIEKTSEKMREEG
jgi:hypothetical protein|nr:MAG TPA: hypothetical protein [Caudoviricetes sp.]